LNETAQLRLCRNKKQEIEVQGFINPSQGIPYPAESGINLKDRDAFFSGENTGGEKLILGPRFLFSQSPRPAIDNPDRTFVKRSGPAAQRRGIGRNNALTQDFKDCQGQLIR